MKFMNVTYVAYASHFFGAFSNPSSSTWEFYLEYCVYYLEKSFYHKVCIVSRQCCQKD